MPYVTNLSASRLGAAIDSSHSGLTRPQAIDSPVPRENRSSVWLRDSTQHLLTSCSVVRLHKFTVPALAPACKVSHGPFILAYMVRFMKLFPRRDWVWLVGACASFSCGYAIGAATERQRLKPQLEMINSMNESLDEEILLAKQYHALLVIHGPRGEEATLQASRADQ